MASVRVSSKYTKLGNVDTFVKFENKLNREIDHFNFEKCEFVLKLIRLLTVSNSFPLEVVQKWQCSQLCVLQENSIRGGNMLVLYMLYIV